MLTRPLRNSGLCALTMSLALGCTGQLGGVGTDQTLPGASQGNGQPGASSGTGSTGGASGPGDSGAGARSAGTGASTGAGSAGTAAGGTGGAGSTTTPGGSGSGSAPAIAAGDPTAAGLRPLRLLSSREYLNTVRDLLGDTAMVATALPADNESPASGFPFHMQDDVATLDATQYRDAAQGLAARAITKLGTLLPCSTTATTTNDTACLNTFMTTLALKMYRRPLSTSDIAGLTTLYNLAKAPAPNGLALTFGNAIGFVMEAILQSPEFLYHWEVDSTKASIDAAAPAGSTVVKLGNYEMASRLSYFVWGSMPDQALLDAAAAGQLADASSVEVQLRRMVKDSAKAGAMFSDFFVDWLDLDTLASKPKDATAYPTFNDALAASMLSEVQSFVSSIMMTGSGRFDEVMTGTSSFANQALASVYGITGVTGTALKPVALDPSQRSGLLTSAAFMSLTGASDGSLPPRRGNAILNKLLCRALPPPPAVVPDPQPVSPGLTTRQRFEQHSQNPCATACHAILDPLGFAFENYDGIGQYRSTDNSQPVNAQVTLTLDGNSQTVSDARGLTAAIASSGEARACFARQWLRYAVRRLDSDADAASLGAATTTFESASNDVRELIVGIGTSRTFRFRTLSPGEVLQ